VPNSYTRQLLPAKSSREVRTHGSCACSSGAIPKPESVSTRARRIHGPKKLAQRYLTEALRERDMGIVVEPETAALGRYLDRWLETSAKPRPRMNTLEDYRKLLTRYVHPVSGGRPLSRIRTLEIQGAPTGHARQRLARSAIRYFRSFRRRSSGACWHTTQQAMSICRSSTGRKCESWPRTRHGSSWTRRQKIDSAACLPLR
jgi:hypothetical protein